MSEFIASPRATSAPFEPVVVALGAAATKTVLQVATPSTTDIRICGWGVSFDGASGTAVPGWCQLIDTAVAATTGTSLTPDLWGNADSGASVCVGGTALTAYNLTVEGTITGTPRGLDSQLVHPQAGYGIWFPEVRLQPRVKASSFLRLRCKFPAAVNVIPWIVWAEPPSETREGY